MCVWCLSTSANSSSSSMAGKLEATAGYAGTPNSLNSSSSSAVAASVAARDALASAVGDPAGRPNDEKSSSSSSAAAPGHTVPHRVRAQYTGRGARARAGLGGRSHLLQRPALQSRPPTARLTSSWPPLLAAASCVAGAGGSANTTFVEVVHPRARAREGAVCSCDPASRHAIEHSHHCGEGKTIFPPYRSCRYPPQASTIVAHPRCRLPPAPTCFSPLRSASQGPDECGQRQKRKDGSMELSTGPRRGARSASVALSWATKGAGVQRLWLWEGRLWNAC